MTTSPNVVAVAARPNRSLTAADIMRAPAVAELTGFSTETIYRWARDGAMPAHGKGNRRYFLRWEVEAWLVS